MPRIFILEGPDGAGKTTLAEQLKAHYQTQHYIHSRTKSRHEYLDMLLTAEREKAGTVFDRLHLSELVYGAVFRGRDSLGGIVGYAELAKVQHRIGARTIITLPPYQVSFDKWRARADQGGEFFDKTDLYKRCHDRWLMAAEIDHQAVVYDWTQAHAFKRLVEQLDIALEPLSLIRPKAQS